MSRSQLSCCSNHVSAAHPPWGKSSSHGLSCCWRFWCRVEKGDKKEIKCPKQLLAACFCSAGTQLNSNCFWGTWVLNSFPTNTTTQNQTIPMNTALFTLLDSPDNLLMYCTYTRMGISTQVLSECHFPALCPQTQLVRWSARPKQWAFVFWKSFYSIGILA